TIAFIFPFNSQKVFITDLSQSKYYFPEETQIAAEFLQGALLAANALKEEGLDAKILVYDSGSDSSTIKTVLRNPDLKNAALIFAPFDNYQLKMVSNFAEREHVPVVSPLSVSFSNADSNHYLILANASLKTHCEQLYDYMLTRALAHRTLMVYRKNQQDEEIANYFKKFAAQKTGEGSYALKFIEITDSSKTTYSNLRDSLFQTDVNQILIPSIDEPFVRTMLKELYNLRDDYKFRVYGLPTWNSFDLIPDEQFDSLNVVITASFWLNKTSQAATDFKTKYSAEYGVNPSEYSVRGYDEGFYFFSQLMEHEDLCSALPSEKPTSLLATSYNFSSEETDKPFRFLENRSIFLLGRSDGKWIPIR
ncbi:MAG: ABC transporter substrate-binding protein, partial [Chitinophagales bacterium]